MRNYLYEIYAIDDKGWGAAPDGLWGADYVAEEDRLFATAREARAAAREIMGAGCWWVEPDDEERYEDIPEIGVRKRCVYEWLWGDHDEAVTDRVVELHGGPVELAAMPTSVAQWLLREYGGARGAWQRQSAALQGASSATHTAAFIAARYQGRVREIHDLLAARNTGEEG